MAFAPSLFPGISQISSSGQSSAFVPVLPSSRTSLHPPLPLPLYQPPVEGVLVDSKTDDDPLAESGGLGAWSQNVCWGPAVEQNAFPEDPEVVLEDRGLWRRFHRQDNEMIITRTGRRMFPRLKLQVKGLDKERRYTVALEMVALGDCRYHYHGARWSRAGPAHPDKWKRVCVHPNSPRTGAQWEQQGLSFLRLKLSNGYTTRHDVVSLNSMHKYQPRLHILAADSVLKLPHSSVRSFDFPETQFYTVTAYQNETIIRMKISCNPFAKGFRQMRAARIARKQALASLSSPEAQGKKTDDTIDNDDAKCDSMDSPVVPSDEVAAKTQKPMTTNNGSQKDTILDDTERTQQKKEASDDEQKPSPSQSLQHQGAEPATAFITQSLAAECVWMAMFQSNDVSEEQTVDWDTETHTVMKHRTKTKRPTATKCKTDNKRKTSTRQKAERRHDRDRGTQMERDRLDDRRDISSQATSMDNVMTGLSPPHPCSDIRVQPASLLGTCNTGGHVVAPMTRSEGGTRKDLCQDPAAGLQRGILPDRCRQLPALGDLHKESASDVPYKRCANLDLQKNSVFTDLFKPPETLGNLRKDSFSTGIWEGFINSPIQMPFSATFVPHTGISASVSPNDTALKNCDFVQIRPGPKHTWKQEIQRARTIADSCRSALDGKGENVPGFPVPRPFAGLPMFPNLYAPHQYFTPPPTCPLPCLFHPLMLGSARPVPPHLLPSPFSVQACSPGFLPCFPSDCQI